MISKQEQLPKGWTIASFGDVTDQGVSQEGPGDIPEFTYVDIGSIDRESKRIVDAKILSSANAPSRARQVLHNGDVLVSMTRPNLNAVAIVSEKLDGAVGSTGFYVLRTRCICPSLLYYAVQTNTFVDAMCRLVQGALYPAVRPKDISAYQLPIPPLPEQHRIVAKIEELFSDLDAGEDALKKTKDLLKRYRNSVLKSAFEGKLTAKWREANQGKLEHVELDAKRLSVATSKNDVVFNDGRPLPHIWQDVRLGQVLRDLKYGTAKKCGYNTSLTPILRIPNIKDGGIDHGDLKYTRLTDDELGVYALTSGDVLIIRSNGSLSLVGRPAIVTKDDEGFGFAGYLMRMRFNRQAITPSFIAYCLISPELRRQIEKVARSTSGVNNINSGEIRNLSFWLPSLMEQNEIVAEIERRFTIADQVEKTVEHSLKQSQRLRQSILKRAFSGKLVRQDPKEEPAGRLLERIKTERAKSESHKPAKTRRPNTSQLEINL